MRKLIPISIVSFSVSGCDFLSGSDKDDSYLDLNNDGVVDVRYEEVKGGYYEGRRSGSGLRSEIGVRPYILHARNMKI